MTILAAFINFDLLVEPLAGLTLLAIVAIVGFMGCRYALKFRNRGKSWMIY